jgi:hypothetical protein
LIAGSGTAGARAHAGARLSSVRLAAMPGLFRKPVSLFFGIML